MKGGAILNPTILMNRIQPIAEHDYTVLLDFDHRYTGTELDAFNELLVKTSMLDRRNSSYPACLQALYYSLWIATRLTPSTGDSDARVWLAVPMKPCVYRQEPYRTSPCSFDTMRGIVSR